MATNTLPDYMVRYPVTNQVHECSCGTLTKGKSCPDCGKQPFPCWWVLNRKGHRLGYVCGSNSRDALESAEATPLYDHCTALAVEACMSMD